MTRLLLKIELVPHSEQRYATAGDWQVDDQGVICIKVSDTGKWSDGYLLGIHEAVEALLCCERGVSEADVDAFDMGFKGSGEPGEDPKAPYRLEHAAADVVERLMARELGVPWQEYSDRVDDLFEEKKR